MQPASVPHYPALNGLRGLAAFWVLLYHAWQAAGAPVMSLGPIDFTPVFACGYFGVDLFFVLSGFLLGYPYVRARIDGSAFPRLGIFWQRRIRRVMPAYLFQIAVLSGIAIATTGALPLSSAQYLAHLFLVFNLEDGAAMLNPVYWSLPVEWDFYLILPLLALSFSRGDGWRRAAATALCIAVGFRALCWYYLDRHGVDGLPVYRWIIQLPARVDQFVFGMIAAHLCISGVRPLHGRLLGLAGCVLLLAMAWASAPLGDIFGQAVRPWLMWHFTLVGAAFGALIVHCATARNLCVRWLSSSPLAFLGLISYSLYLWHFPILGALRQLPSVPAAGTALWWCVVVGSALLIAFISYHFVERPFLPARGRERQPPPAAGQTQAESTKPLIRRS